MDLPHGGKAVHHLILDGQGQNGQGAHPDGGEGLRRQIGLAGKEPHEEGSRQPGQYKEHRHIRHAQDRDVFLRLEDPLPPAGAVVEGQDRLGAAGDPAQGHGHHQHEALGNGGAGHQPVSQSGAAVALQHRVHGNDHHVVDGDDEKGRKAHRQNVPHELTLITAEGDADGHLPAEEEAEHIHAAGQLGEHRGQ